MKSPILQLVIFFHIVLCCSTLTAQDDLELNARVSATTIGLDQQFQLEVELSGSEARSAPEPEIPAVDEFASYLGSGTSTNMQIVNGRMTVSKVYTHHFVATKVGKFQIPAVKLSYQGKEYSSQPIAVEVVKGRAGTSGPSAGSNRARPNASPDLSDRLFLKAEVNKRRVYQNEPVIVTYKIYTAVNVSNYGISQLPNTVGFWAEEFDLPQRPRLYNETVNGQTFRVADIKKMALFPQGPGDKTLSPLVIQCEVQLPRSRRNRDIFDSFFDDPFFSRSTKQTIRSNAVTVDVLPLPETNKPANFSGAVGNFSVSTSVDKNTVKTNEAITFKFTVSGTGNIKILPQPEIVFPQDFEVYDPKVTEKINRASNTISGSKTFEYVLIPRFPGSYTLGPVQFSFFEPQAKSYKTVSEPPIELAVAKGDEPFVSTGGATSKEDVKFIGQDIRFIQLQASEFRRAGSIFYKKVYFYVALILPLLAFGAAFVYRQHRDKLSSNVAYARSRQANRVANKRLNSASKELRDGNQREFYAEVSRALRGFIGDKFNISAAGLITDDVTDVLKNRGVDSETIEQYVECLQTCDYQRFAPSESDNGQMKTFFDKAKQAVINLDKSL